MLPIYDIIQGPRLTEKGQSLQSDYNQLVLRVHQKANKIQIREAVETLFNVKVISVRTSINHGKRKRVGKYQGRTQCYKKAFVTLRSGNKVDFLGEL